MIAKERREAIKQILKSSSQAISASALAARFSVSRQIIVGDIALLRSGGMQIDATPRGYLIHREESGIRKEVVCTHSGNEELQEELNTFVDYGCKVLNVSVEHPIYGRLTGELNIESRYDVELFIEKSNEADALPLSALTEGVHSHTLLCDSLEGYKKAIKILKKKGIVISSG